MSESSDCSSVSSESIKALASDEEDEEIFHQSGVEGEGDAQ